MKPYHDVRPPGAAMRERIPLERVSWSLFIVSQTPRITEQKCTVSVYSGWAARTAVILISERQSGELVIKRNYFQPNESHVQ